MCPYCKAGGFKNEAGVRVHTSKMHKAEMAWVDLPRPKYGVDTTQGDGNVNPYNKGDQARLEPGAVWGGGPGPDDVGTVLDVTGDNVQVSWFEGGVIEWLGVDDLRMGAKDVEPDTLVMKAPTCRVEFTLLVSGTKTGEDVRDLVLRATAKWKQHGLHLTELYVSNPK